MSQGLAVVLSRHAGRLDVHASQQSPVARHHTHREQLLGGPLLLTLFGSSVLKPHLQREGWIREKDRSAGFQPVVQVIPETPENIIQFSWLSSTSVTFKLFLFLSLN